jgi:hypothetical protein
MGYIRRLLFHRKLEIFPRRQGRKCGDHPKAKTRVQETCDGLGRLRLRDTRLGCVAEV